MSRLTHFVFILLLKPKPFNIIFFIKPYPIRGITCIHHHIDNPVLHLQNVVRFIKQPGRSERAICVAVYVWLAVARLRRPGALDPLILATCAVKFDWICQLTGFLNNSSLLPRRVPGAARRAHTIPFYHRSYFKEKERACCLLKQNGKGLFTRSWKNDDLNDIVK